jgi:hypothetical protein
VNKDKSKGKDVVAKKVNDATSTVEEEQRRVLFLA